MMTLLRVQTLIGSLQCVAHNGFDLTKYVLLEIDIQVRHRLV